MRRHLISALALLAAGPAFGADMAVKAPAPLSYAPVYDFSGIYIGPHIGYGWNTGAINAPLVSGFDFKDAPQGFLGGLHGGIGKQFQQLYFGAEGDFDLTAIDGTASMAGLLFQGKNRWTTSLRARVGWIPIGHMMVYGTAGWAWSSGDFSISNGVASVSTSATLNGAVAGGGLEVPFDPHWSGRVEYLHYFLNDISTPVAPTLVFNAAQNIDVIRGGVSYKF